jgi:hypothetical protein
VISPGRLGARAGLELAAAVALEELDLLAVPVEGEQVDRAVAGEVGDPQAGRAHAGGDGAGDELALTATEEDVHGGAVARGGGGVGGDGEVEQAVVVEVGGLDRGRLHRELEAGGEAQAAAAVVHGEGDRVAAGARDHEGEVGAAVAVDVGDGADDGGAADVDHGGVAVAQRCGRLGAEHRGQRLLERGAYGLHAAADRGGRDDGGGEHGEAKAGPRGGAGVGGVPGGAHGAVAEWFPGTELVRGIGAPTLPAPAGLRSGPLADGEARA